ncbi:MAG: mannose-1-phosphate guanylyltransferase [candidate division KSB1 bacterium]
MMALIMAGGSGTRFWPKSRESHPKQLLQIVGEGTMLQNTVRRLNPLISAERIFIVCKESQREALLAQVPQLPAQNIIVEPWGKNTAPCIGLAALFMRKRFGDEVMVVLPADHLIGPAENFRAILATSGRIASERKVLITIGIPPTFPATGYGYIQRSNEVLGEGTLQAQKVKAFAEKPNLETAQRFLASGDFLWNSGMFVWRVSTIMEQFEEHLPQLSDGLREIDQALGQAHEHETIGRVYQQIKSISIDYGVMEKAKEVVVLPANFEWNDIGSWDEVYKLSDKDKDQNALNNDNHLLYESTGCLVEVKDKVVATVGVHNLVIVESEGALLICPRERAQEVKELVELLKRKKMTDLL